MKFDEQNVCILSIHGGVSDFRISESFFCQRDTHKDRSTKVLYLTGSKFRKQ
jgi:hypothetical protein